MSGKEDTSRSDYYCLNQGVADGNYRMTFDDVDLKIQCENTLSGASFLSALSSLVFGLYISL